jgi:hypothetical protein
VLGTLRQHLKKHGSGEGWGKDRQRLVAKEIVNADRRILERSLGVNPSHLVAGVLGCP